MDLTIMAKPLASELIKMVSQTISKKYFSEKKQELSETNISENIEFHLKRSIKWASSIQHYSMYEPVDLDSIEVQLKLSTPKKMRGSNAEYFDVFSILGKSNTLILGAPGSGKTTTIRKIIRRLVTTEGSQSDSFSFPLLIRLREDGISYEIEKKIADTIGLPYMEKQKDKSEWRDREVPEYGFFSTVNGKKVELVHAVSEVLNENKILVLLDGLDEYPDGKRSRLIESILTLSEHLDDSQMIITCRSGGYVQTMKGFTIAEICPLESKKIKELSEKWGIDTKKFLTHLDDLPYKDVANRPLLVTHLIILFKNYGYLPNQPFEVYSMLLRLQLTEWDRQRGIVRKSRYSNFGVEKKQSFMAALAFELLVKTTSTIFSRAELNTAYLSIADNFGLSKCQASEVIQELETHTGIISETSDNKYEFSHLSIQEYLCADHMVRDPIGPEFMKYIWTYPAPVAIAVCLSSNPSNFFSMIFLNDHISSDETNSISVFLDRLRIERPIFRKSLTLGFAMLKIGFLYDKKKLLVNEREWLYKDHNIRESIKIALNKSHIEEGMSTPDDIYIKFDGLIDYQYRNKTNTDGWLSRTLYEEYLV